MTRSIFILLIMLIAYTSSFAQYSLKGRVVASDTRHPIVSANIFLSNTSVGTISNQNGEFIINRFPDGLFDLVVSCIGYETFILSIQSNQLPANLEVAMVSKVHELQEVIVESYDRNGWEKWGTVFTDNFIGTSAFAADCKLVNKDVVRFRFDKKRNTVKATANDQLIIENNFLGYILKYSLTKFEFNLDNKEFLYQGYPFFEEMQTNRKAREKKWIHNRQIAYYGSLVHFMRSLYQDKLGEQQFEVREWVTIPDEERKRIKGIYHVQSKKLLSERTPIVMENGNEIVVDDHDSSRIIHPDSLAYYQSVMQQIDRKNVLINILLTGKTLTFRVDNITVGLHHKDHLQVVYRPKINPVDYQKYIQHYAYYSPVTSELHSNSDKIVMVLSNGSYPEGINLMVSGYWAWWEKMCNKLPYEYWPPKKESPNR